MTHISTATAAQSGRITTIKQEDGVSIPIKPEHDSFSHSDLPAFVREENGMEVIYEDGLLEEEDADVQEEEIAVIKFGPHHGANHANKFESNRPRTIIKRKPDFQEDEPRTKSDEDSDSDSDSAFESMSLGTRKRRKTKTGRANTTTISTTGTQLKPETTTVLPTKQIITQIFSSSPRAHSDIHTYPLPPDQPHRHSYHSPLLLSFPSNSKSCYTENSTAAARKHRDALLAWFDTYSAARQMPWRKAWVDASPLLYPASGIPSSSITITTTSVPPSMPTTSNSEPTSNSLVAPKVKASPPIPESALLFPNLAAAMLRAQAEAEAQKQQARAEAEARARARVQAKVEAAARLQSQKLQLLRPIISQRFYETLLSEILRQIFHETDHEQSIQNITTQYDRWIKAFPTLEDLAKAKEEKVEELSDDIRATRLHNAAKQICEGKSFKNLETTGLPTTVEKLQNLSGVGPHTAGVVAAVVFGRAEPMVIWDVTRVLARQLGIRADANKNAAREVIWEAARRLVEQVAWDGVEAEEEAKAKWLGISKQGTRKNMNEGESVVDGEERRRNRGPPPLSDRPGRWGQALMELGAAVCLAAPKTPLCHLCPIQATCRAYAEGLEIAREEGMMVGIKATRKEKDRQALKKKVYKLQKQKVVDIEDAACSLCRPPPLSSSIFPLAGQSSDTSTTKIKMENQDEIWQPGEYLEDTDTDTEVHYLGTVPKTAALPSTKDDTQTTQDTTQQTHKRDENTISTTFYEQNSWLRLSVDLKRRKPIPDYLDLTAREFITTYCAQYPYTTKRKQT